MKFTFLILNSCIFVYSFTFRKWNPHLFRPTHHHDRLNAANDKNGILDGIDVTSAPKDDYICTSSDVTNVDSGNNEFDLSNANSANHDPANVIDKPSRKGETDETISATSDTTTNTAFSPTPTDAPKVDLTEGSVRCRSGDVVITYPRAPQTTTESANEVEKEIGGGQNTINEIITENLKELGVASINRLQEECLAVIPNTDYKNYYIMSGSATGKTLAYLLPLIKMITEEDSPRQSPRALILVPSYILAVQIHEVVNKVIKNLPLKAAICDSIETGEMADIVISLPKSVIKKFKIYDLNYKVNSFSNIRYIILDEADLLMNVNYRPVIDRILALTTLRKKCIASLSSLSTGGTRSKSVFLNKSIPGAVKIRHSTFEQISDNITIKDIHCSNFDEKVVQLENILKHNTNNRIFVFVNTITSAEHLFGRIKYRYRAAMVTRNLLLDAQIGVTKSTMRISKILLYLPFLPMLTMKRCGVSMILTLLYTSFFPSFTSFNFSNHVIITTELFSRGIDMKNVNVLINFDYPVDVSRYIQRAGRIGREGQQAQCISFFTDETAGLARLISDNTKKLSILQNIEDDHNKNINCHN